MGAEEGRLFVRQAIFRKSVFEPQAHKAFVVKQEYIAQVADHPLFQHYVQGLVVQGHQVALVEGAQEQRIVRPVAAPCRHLILLQHRHFAALRLVEALVKPDLVGTVRALEDEDALFPARQLPHIRQQFAVTRFLPGARESLQKALRGLIREPAHEDAVPEEA